jgi:FixJ family two-component response regulator
MVYIIDADDSVRRGFRLLLDSAGIDHQGFSNATDFLNNYKNAIGNLVVLDLKLPDMDGIQLLKTFNSKKINPPVLIVTTVDDPQSRDYCRQFGVKAFMRKPVDAEALLDIIMYNLPKC